MAYVPVAPSSADAEEDAAAARRRRRVELARGWKFKCECARCLAEALADLAREDAEKTGEEDKAEADEDEELGVTADESRVEAVMRHENVKAPLGDVMGPD